MSELKKALAFRNFSEESVMAKVLAETVAGRLKQAVSARGRAVMAVSGGRSPVSMYRALARHAVPWSRIELALVDERWVDRTNSESNEKLVRDHLLLGMSGEANFISVRGDASEPVSACHAANLALSDLQTPFDLVILGLGEDGHTASWFPQADGLRQALDQNQDGGYVALLPRGTKVPRLSLNLAAVLNSRSIVIQYSGSAKHQTMQRALQPGEHAELPIRSVLHQSRVPVEIWSAGMA